MWYIIKCVVYIMIFVSRGKYVEMCCVVVDKFMFVVNM